VQPGAPIGSCQGKQNAMVQVNAIFRSCEHLHHVRATAVAKSVQEALPKICGNDKKKEVLGGAPL
jgi:hypothetical protein